MSVRLSGVFLLGLLIVPVARAATWTVYPDGSGDAPTIMAAIDSAAGNGDVIELADGIFTGEGNRDLYNMEKMIFIRSVSGNPEACILDAQGTPEEHHWVMVFSGDG